MDETVKKLQMSTMMARLLTSMCKAAGWHLAIPDSPEEGGLEVMVLGKLEDVEELLEFGAGDEFFAILAPPSDEEKSGGSGSMN